jgi:hypothetical protein
LDRIPNKLELDGGRGVLFLPERNERGFDPVAKRLGAVKAGMARGADGMGVCDVPERDAALHAKSACILLVTTRKLRVLP